MTQLKCALLVTSFFLIHNAPLPAGQIQTIAGTGRIADGGSGGPALETNIGNPFGVEVGPDGALYITEVSNHRQFSTQFQIGRHYFSNKPLFAAMLASIGQYLDL